MAGFTSGRVKLTCATAGLGVAVPRVRRLGGGIRTHGAREGTPVFETGLFNQLQHLSARTRRTRQVGHRRNPH